MALIGPRDGKIAESPLNMRHARRTAVEQHVAAEIAPSAETIVAGETGPARIDGDRGADGEMVDGFADLDDFASDLVTENHRLFEREVSDLAFEIVGEIRPAYAACLDRDAHLVRGKRRGCQVDQSKVLGPVNLKRTHPASPFDRLFYRLCGRTSRLI